MSHFWPMWTLSWSLSKTLPQTQSSVIGEIVSMMLVWS